jgi:hypothetical protein
VEKPKALERGGDVPPSDHENKIADAAKKGAIFKFVGKYTDKQEEKCFFIFLYF